MMALWDSQSIQYIGTRKCVVWRYSSNWRSTCLFFCSFITAECLTPI